MTMYITRTPEAPSNLKTEAESAELRCRESACFDERCVASKCAHWLWVEGEGVEWERERREGRGRFSLAQNRHIPTDVPDGWELDPTMGTQAAEFKRDEEVGLIYYIRRPIKVHPPRGICGLVHRTIQLERAP